MQQAAKGWVFATAVVLGGGMAALLPIPEAPWGRDGAVHAANVLLLSSALEAGDWLPDWSPELNGGRGGLNFRYYGILAYYPAAMLRARWGTEALEGIALTLRGLFLAGFAGTAALAIQRFGAAGSLAAASLFSLSPYPLALIWARLALPEYAALSLAPWVLLALGQTARRGEIWMAATASVGVAALVLVHSLAAILWLPVVLLYGATQALGAGRGRMSLVAYSVGGGLLLAAFRFGPAALELGWIDAARQLGDAESYRAWSIPILSLLSNEPDVGFSARMVPGPLCMAVLAGALVWLARLRLQVRSAADRPADAPVSVAPLVGRGDAALAAGLLLLATPLGSWIAYLVPALAYVQHPWRFLGPATLFCSLLCASFLQRTSCLRGLVGAGFLLLLGWFTMLPQHGRSVPSHYPILSLQDWRQVAYSADFESKYLPLGARALPAPNDADILLPESARLLDLRTNRGVLEAEIDASKDVEVILRRHWDPAWRLGIDGGSPSVPERDAANGEILVRLPPGQHRVRLERPIRSTSLCYAGVTLAAILGWALGAIGAKRRAAALPSLLACVVTAGVGLSAKDGFAPGSELWRSLSADAPEPPGAEDDERVRRGAPLEQLGWNVLVYDGPPGSSPSLRGTALELNLAPGGFIRSGLAVWTGLIERAADEDLAFEGSGGVALFVGGNRVGMPKDAPRSVHGLPIVQFPDTAGGGAAPASLDVAVLAGSIESGAYARILTRPRDGRAPWRLLPAHRVRPNANAGFRELFRGIAELEPH